MKEKLLKNRKLLGGYILWFTLHLVLLLVSISGRGDDRRYTRLFWPFGHLGREDAYHDKMIYQYDFTEFLIYIIVPMALYSAYLLLNPKFKPKN